MGPIARIESQIPLLILELLLFVVVRRVEPADNPALPLDDGQADDDHHSGSVVASGLFQAVTPLGLVILIADQQDGLQLGDGCEKAHDRSAGRRRVGLARHPAEMPVRTDADRAGQLWDGPLRQPTAPGFLGDPLPLVGDQVFVQPIDGLHQHAVRQLGRGVEVSLRFVDDGKAPAHAVTPSTIHFSPNRLHISPGVISSFHFGNFGWLVKAAHTVAPSSFRKVMRTSSVFTQSSM